MEITPEVIYWITRVDGFKDLLNEFGIIFTVVGTFGCIIAMICIMEKYVSKWFLLIWTIPFIGIIFLVLNVFIPTTKQLAAMYGIPVLVNKEGVQKLPDKILTLADEWLEELRPEKTK